MTDMGPAFYGTGSPPVGYRAGDYVEMFKDERWVRWSDPGWNFKRKYRLAADHPHYTDAPIGNPRRDHFAMAALIGIGTWVPRGFTNLDSDGRQARAQFAVQQADALMAELAK